MKSSTFQIVLISCFGFFVVIALFLFATYRASNSNALPKVTLWGTVSTTDFNAVLGPYNTANGNTLNIVYVQKKADTFDQSLIEAIASGNGPDAVFLPQDLILREQNKLYVIPESTYPLRTFQDTFIDEASLYITPQGILALPFSVDPLVMYWNKDIFNTAGIVFPPKKWNEFLTLVPQLTQKDAANNVTQSAVALGEYGNITNAKEIVSALMLQAGNPIIALQNNLLIPTLDTSGGTTLAPSNSAQSVLSFYTQFSDPTRTSYSWNRALQNSQDAFLAGDLGVYFGFASEFNSIKARNPNLHFDVAELPQPLSSKTKITFGRLSGLAIVRTSKQILGTFQTLVALSSPDFVSQLSALSKVPPALRSLLSQGSNDPNTDLFYKSALISRGWLDPNPGATNGIFRDMIEGVSSGRTDVNGAVTYASSQLKNLISPGQ